MKDLSVVIPALDEEKAIGSVIDELFGVLNRDGRKFEIIVVDDGSTDKTSEIAKSRNIRLLRHPIPGGYGLSIRDGISASQYEYVAIVDGDGTYPVSCIPQLLDNFNGYDMVIGARGGKAYRESLIKNPFRKLLQILCEFVVGHKIPDVNSGLRIFKKDTILRFKESFCLGFSFTTTITLAFHLSGYFVKYVPIEYYKRIGRRPHVKFLRDSLRTLQIVTQAILYFNPIKLFLLLALFALSASMILLVFYLIKQSLFSLTAGMTFFLIACMFVGMGFVADVLRQTNRQFSS